MTWAYESYQQWKKKFFSMQSFFDLRMSVPKKWALVRGYIWKSFAWGSFWLGPCGLAAPHSGAFTSQFASLGPHSSQISLHKASQSLLPFTFQFHLFIVATNSNFSTISKKLNGSSKFKNTYMTSSWCRYLFSLFFQNKLENSFQSYENVIRRF